MKRRPMRNSKSARFKADKLPPPDPRELRRLEKMSDDDIDYSEIPPIDASAVAKQRATMISLRLEQELLDWFKRGGPGYQTRIRRALREYMRWKTEGHQQVEEIADAVVRRLQADTSKRDRKSPSQLRRRKSA